MGDKIGAGNGKINIYFNSEEKVRGRKTNEFYKSKNDY